MAFLAIALLGRWYASGLAVVEALPVMMVIMMMTLAQVMLLVKTTIEIFPGYRRVDLPVGAEVGADSYRDCQQ
jgi:hypothetical protein